MLTVGVNIVQALDIFGNIMEQYITYSTDREKFMSCFSNHANEIASEDISKCNVTAKDIALALFKNDENKYRRQIVALAGDTAKSVRDTVSDIITNHPDWTDEIKITVEKEEA